MKIETLRLITQILEIKNITKVAELNHISQSALSQHIKSLEDHFNVNIITRSNRGIEITPQGIIFYRHAKNIVDCYDTLQVEIQQKQINTPIRIFSNPLFSNYALPCSLLDLQNHFPNHYIEMLTFPSNLVEQKVISGEADIGFINGKPKSMQLVSKMIHKDALYFVASSESSYPDTIDIETLPKIPMIMSSGRSITRDNIDNSLSKIGFDPSSLFIRYQMDSIESVKLSVLNQHGCSFLPYSSIKKELYHKQLRIIKIPNLEIYNEFYLIINPTYLKYKPELKPVLDYLQSVISQSLC